MASNNSICHPPLLMTLKPAFPISGGIPVGPEHRRDLEDIAAEFGVDVPWPRDG